MNTSVSQALANRASLQLGSMAPVGDAPTMDRGKVFAGLYELYAGQVVMVAAALACVPVLLRLLHEDPWHKAAYPYGVSGTPPGKPSDQRLEISEGVGMRAE